MASCPTDNCPQITYCYRMHPLITIGCTLALVGAAYVSTRKLIEVIMATKDEVIESLTQVNETLTKVSGETTSLLVKIDELQEAIDNAEEVPEEISALVAEIRAKVTSIDEMVADTPVTDPENPTPAA